jgi:hypothetical protein
LIRDPGYFNGKVVRVKAQFETDGIHFAALVDPKCAGGVVPSGRIDVVERFLLESFRRGCAAARDKQITASFVGEYHWQPENTPRTGKFPRWLDVQTVEELDVKPRPGALACP